jgi:peroxiredoxin Q/BCP
MKQAPPFNLPDQTGKDVSLSDYAGKWLIVYFYPKDDTPGCTTEACSFRDEYEFLQEKGLSVVGISKDSIKSHAKFAEKYNLKFPLLADLEHEVIEAYGSWGPKKFMGRQFFGIHRNTYLINPKGEIVKEYQGVTPKEHVGQIMKDFSTLIS